MGLWRLYDCAELYPGRLDKPLKNNYMSTIEQLTEQVAALQETVKLLQQRVKTLEDAKEKEAGEAAMKKEVDSYRNRFGN